jgi:non-ribosomal peptide synthetase component F
VLGNALQQEPDSTPSPLFRALFLLENTSERSLKFGEMPVSPPQVDLTLALVEDGSRLQGLLEYNPDLFEETTIDRFLGHFRVLLAGIVADPQQSIDELPLLMEAERQQLLIEWNRTEADYPRDACVHELFEAQVRRTPDALALVFGEHQVTYQALNALADQVARSLRRLGVGPETPVGLCLERSIELVTGLLAILKTGGAYVPLDPVYPPEALAQLVADAGISIILTQRTLTGRLPTSSQLLLLPLDTPATARSASKSENPGPALERDLLTARSNNLCYVLYTSGSTGSPTGVAVDPDVYRT